MEAEERDDAFYSALIGAFLQTRMERDKSLLALSSGGVGLTVTLISTIGADTDFQLICFVSMLGSFAMTILLMLSIFRVNSIYAKGIIKQINDNICDKRYIDVVARTKMRLMYLDRFASAFFAIAVMSSCLLGVAFIV